ncbi:MAG: excinuclease ABC subunit UvrA, partial [Bdellovibrionales bacterium]
ALRLSDGLLTVENADDQSQILMSEKFACPVSGFTIAEIEPRIFSFNNPHGACPSCDGLGRKMIVDPDLVVPDKTKSIQEGAIVPWSTSFAPFYMQAMQAAADFYKFDTNTPWQDMDKKHQDIILYGSGSTIIKTTYKSKRRLIETDSNSVQESLTKYQISTHCEACNGKRLKPESLAVKINGETIADVATYSIGEAMKWFSDLDGKLTNQQEQIADKILKEINERLSFLMNVGLDYLNLSRSSGTLSGGESQRIRLASQIGSGLTGVLYVLDEPSIGLHQRDNNRLLETLQHLRDLGNTVIVVEHDEDAIRLADHVIDMGPRAGILGGQVVAAGTPQDIMKCEKSITGQYLTGKAEVPIPAERRKGHAKQFIEVNGARGNNLKNINAKIPLGTFTCITGVSGSGKSTLTIDTLYKGASRDIMRTKETPLEHDEIKGLQFIDKIIDIDQSPIGRTPRSNPATYTGAFGPIREWFAGLPESKARGYKAGRFSFNVKGGRCEACQGDGVIKIEMHFLPDVYVECETCKGKRYNRETLEVKFKDKSIADVLDMSIDEGAEFFKAVPSIRDKMETLRKVGLGYIKVGQQATTLSGGEAQRVKLAKELSKRSTGKTLYILDEPTTGLHFDDVKKLMEVLHSLVDKGNSIVVIEHNLDVIKTADHIIDIGPDGGDKGGMIVASGTPEEICSAKQSYTGQFLKPILEKPIKKTA